jgi:hypothetical protein
MKDLETYLNDHLGGSAGAIEMLDDLIDKHDDDALKPFLKTLRADIESDQGELKRLLLALGISESGMRKAGAWVAEKFSRLKLGSTDSSEVNLPLLQSLESLSLGITGKRSLWRTLGAVGTSSPRLSGFDFALLEQRAADQFERTQAKAIEIAAKIFPAELNRSK